MNTLITFIRRDWWITKMRHAARIKFWREYRRYRAKGFGISQARFYASLVL